MVRTKEVGKGVMQNLKTKVRKLEEQFNAANKTEAILMVPVDYGDSAQEEEEKLQKFLSEQHPGKTRDDFSSIFFLTSFKDVSD